ncbi:MAG TPA: class I SAM-dependent methyltransferase [Bryobacteraceae bacterium]
MLDSVQYHILRSIAPPQSRRDRPSSYGGQTSKLSTLMGEAFFRSIQGKIVVDFGCGEGTEAIEMARKGAAKVIGVDIREDVLNIGRQKAEAAGVQDRCSFGTSAAELADVIVSLDAFEHFGRPDEILRIMHGLLKPGGEVWVSFGPTWYHPMGGHLFSVFPWAHLVFSEKALIRWRSDFKSDGATKFSETAGGLNQMTIKRFETLVAASSFEVADLELVPIRKLQPVHNALTREFFTAIVRCRLKRV